MKKGGGWYLIFVAVAVVLGLGVNQGLRISEKVMGHGEAISPRFGFADEDPDARTLYCRYLTWSGVVERVYRFRYSNPDAGSACPLLLEPMAEE